MLAAANTNDEAEALFVTTKRPKSYALIHANNHTFASNPDGFYAASQQGVQWIKQHEARNAGQLDESNARTAGIELVASPF